MDSIENIYGKSQRIEQHLFSGHLKIQLNFKEKEQILEKKYK